MNFDGINWIDYGIVGIIGISAVISLIRGFVKEALSLVAWISAFWVGITFAKEGANYLEPYIRQGTLRHVAAFVALFVITLFLAGLVNLLIAQIIERSGLSGTDRMIGMIFGAGRGVLLVALILLTLKMTSLSHSDKWQNSALIPNFNPLEKWLCGFLPKEVDFDKKYTQVIPAITNVAPPDPHISKDLS